MKHSRLVFLTQTAAIAALYAVLTWLGSFFVPQIGPVEFRFSEALCILPVFTPAAIPGLWIGCLLGNLLCGGVIWDLVFGSLASLLGAIGTCVFRKKKFLPYLCPVLSNSLIIPPILLFAYGFGEGQPVWFFYLVFIAGEAASVFLFGSLLKEALQRTKLFS